MNENTETDDWNPELYLKYKDERTQPSIDLVSRIKIDSPDKIIDIGCGPGNSTQILYGRWPKSQITGLDNSPEMIKKAKNDYPDQSWILSDASDVDPKIKYDLVFSNATIQWIPNHDSLINNLFGILEKNGALAIQIPMFKKMPLSKSIESTANKSKWNQYTKGCDDLFTYHDSGFYYDILCKYSDNIDLWETAYLHIMDSHEAILEWIRSTGLKPYLEKLQNDEMKNEFEKDILNGIKTMYPLQKNGKVLFPFIRLFFIAYN